jgi:hypothetical protein
MRKAYSMRGERIPEKPKSQRLQCKAKIAAFTMQSQNRSVYNTKAKSQRSKCSPARTFTDGEPVVHNDIGLDNDAAAYVVGEGMGDGPDRAHAHQNRLDVLLQLVRRRRLAGRGVALRREMSHANRQPKCQVPQNGQLNQP